MNHFKCEWFIPKFKYQGKVAINTHTMYRDIFSVIYVISNSVTNVRQIEMCIKEGI